MTVTFFPSGELSSSALKEDFASIWALMRVAFLRMLYTPIWTVQSSFGALLAEEVPDDLGDPLYSTPIRCPLAGG